MAKKKRSQRLSFSELRLMGLLWGHGPLTLAETYRLQPGNVGYTTIQTQLNRLVDKGVASRSKTRPMKYRAVVKADVASAGLVQLLIESIGGGSIVPLVAQIVSHAILTKDEIRDMKQLIDASSRKRR